MTAKPIPPPIFVPIRLRTCTVCGHEECPCCRTWCDHVDDKGVCDCFDGCTYSEPVDELGYARLDAAESVWDVNVDGPIGLDSVPGGVNISFQSWDENPIQNLG